MPSIVDKLIIMTWAFFSSGLLFGSLYIPIPTEFREFSVAVTVTLFIVGCTCAVWIIVKNR